MEGRLRLFDRGGKIVAEGGAQRHLIAGGGGDLIEHRAFGAAGRFLHQMAQRVGLCGQTGQSGGQGLLLVAGLFPRILRRRAAMLGAVQGFAAGFHIFQRLFEIHLGGGQFRLIDQLGIGRGQLLLHLGLTRQQALAPRFRFGQCAQGGGAFGIGGGDLFHQARQFGLGGL